MRKKREHLRSEVIVRVHSSRDEQKEIVIRNRGKKENEARNRKKKFIVLTES